MGGSATFVSSAISSFSVSAASFSAFCGSSPRLDRPMQQSSTQSTGESPPPVLSALEPGLWTARSHSSSSMSSAFTSSSFLYLFVFLLSSFAALPFLLDASFLLFMLFLRVSVLSGSFVDSVFSFISTIVSSSAASGCTVIRGIAGAPSPDSLVWRSLKLVLVLNLLHLFQWSSPPRAI